MHVSIGDVDLISVEGRDDCHCIFVWITSFMSHIWLPWDGSKCKYVCIVSKGYKLLERKMYLCMWYSRIKEITNSPDNLSMILNEISLYLLLI